MINKQRGSLFNIDEVFYQQDRYRHRNVPSFLLPQSTDHEIGRTPEKDQRMDRGDSGYVIGLSDSRLWHGAPHRNQEEGLFSKESVFDVMFAQRDISGATGSTKNE